MPGNDLQQQGGVADGVCKGANLIERAGEGHQAESRYPAIGGLESDDAAVGCRYADGSSGIGANGSVAELCCDRGPRSARRTARAVIHVPRITNRAEIADRRTGTVGQFMEVQLAKQHGAGSFEAANDLRVMCWDPILEQPSGGGSAHPLGVDQVLVARQLGRMQQQGRIGRRVLRPVFGDGVDVARVGDDRRVAFQRFNKIHGVTSCGVKVYRTSSGQGRRFR